MRGCPTKPVEYRRLCWKQQHMIDNHEGIRSMQPAFKKMPNLRSIVYLAWRTIDAFPSPASEVNSNQTWYIENGHLRWDASKACVSDSYMRYRRRVTTPSVSMCYALVEGSARIWHFAMNHRYYARTVNVRLRAFIDTLPDAAAHGFRTESSIAAYRRFAQNLESFSAIFQARAKEIELDS